MVTESERRSYPRADVVFELNYTIGENSPSMTALARDVSTGGICFQTADSYEPSTALALDFSMTGLPAPIQARGMVVRSWEDEGEFFTAVRFTDIDGTDMNVILDYIRSQAADIADSVGR